MVYFITFLRAMAACLITNAHYTGVYPTDLIANGGLIGDIIFFAVSGYCLTNVKKSFPSWYGKRVLRCYTPVVIMTAIYMILGFYSLSDHNGFWWYVYPTYYHFVASIIVLYIPFYFIMKVDFLKKNIPWIMVLVGIVYVVVYLLWYDKSYYHIDTVRESFIRFLFMESMLLGAMFKINDAKFRNQFSLIYPIAAIGLFVLYFASKIAFSKGFVAAEYQILNQTIIFMLLYFVLKTFAALDSKLESMPKGLKKCVDFLATITLEIYVVQYVLIDLLRKIAPFPVNWLAITVSILATAYLLHIVSNKVISLIEVFITKLSSKKGEV